MSLTPDTVHLIGRRELTRMCRAAYLVNTSRGPVIDEEALAEALVRRRIALARIPGGRGVPPSGRR